jgi:hypothetical protein
LKGFSRLSRLWCAIWQRLRPETVGGSGALPLPVQPVAARAIALMPSLSIDTVPVPDAVRPYLLRAHAQARWRCYAG